MIQKVVGVRVKIKRNKSAYKNFPMRILNLSFRYKTSNEKDSERGEREREKTEIWKLKKRRAKIENRGCAERA